MNVSDLGEEISIEFESIEMALGELASLRRDVEGRSPTVREVAAAGLFLANMYNGIENILKRISLYHRVNIPSGENWHVELAKGFCDPPREGLPQLLDSKLAGDLGPYRRFRHVVHHAYGFQLQWHQMLPGIERAADVVSRFKERVEQHLRFLEAAGGQSP